MKWLDEFRDPAAIRAACAALAAITTRPWTIMEVCGGQTHTIVRWSLVELLAELLPESIELIHGPGCPVCVTPIELVEQARRLALRDDVILASFGDMMRVPGLTGDLLGARAEGGDVRVVSSPLDALQLAREHAGSGRTVVLFAVGFETTAPATAMAIELAAREEQGLDSFAVLASHVRVPPAMELILADDACRVQGFLAAGHVCTVVGTAEYPAIVERFGVPVVVTGFEPLDILAGLLACVRQLERGEAELEIAYRRAVRPEGNPVARACVERVFEVVDAPWRGLGTVPRGGLRIREHLAHFDALRRFEPAPARARGAPSDDAIGEARAEGAAEQAAGAVGAVGAGRCRADAVLRGLLRPTACPEFGRGCTPEHPLGAPMVSSEGACAAYHAAGRRHREEASA